MLNLMGTFNQYFTVILQLGEEYWTIVNRDGSLRDGRTTADFLPFDATHNSAPVQNAYVAFLITYDAQGHYEVFGQAYIDYDTVCARFVDRYGRNFKTCGGFRVLSRRADHTENRNPFKFVKSESASMENAVEYRGQQAAMISSWHYEEGHYGSADMRQKTAQAVDYAGNVIQVSHREDPIFFNKRVFILTRLSPYEYLEAPVQPSAQEQRDEPIYHTPDEERYKNFNSPPESTDEEEWQFFHSV
ncbi:unnamed protein product [Toxocara canis]|uniref:P22.2 n=1 Tax=Toxocara canis TaxID=6265 RepID=A0A183UKT7_TOXCA|nr:unnamed protein product [Toxocara canis]